MWDMLLMKRFNRSRATFLFSKQDLGTDDVTTNSLLSTFDEATWKQKMTIAGLVDSALDSLSQTCITKSESGERCCWNIKATGLWAMINDMLPMPSQSKGQKRECVLVASSSGQLKLRWV